MWLPTLIKNILSVFVATWALCVVSLHEAWDLFSSWDCHKPATFSPFLEQLIVFSWLVYGLMCQELWSYCGGAGGGEKRAPILGSSVPSAATT